MRPLRVMQVITKGEMGGAQTHVHALCQALGSQVQSCVVIGGPEAAPPLERALRARAIPVFRLAPLTNALHPWRLYRAFRALVQLVRQERPDLLHAHSAAAGVAARWAGWLTATPVVYTVHGFAYKPGVTASRRALAWLCECVCAPFTAHLVCVSTHEQQLARWLPLPARRISVVMNALADHHARCDAPLSPAPARLIFVARMAPPKRPDVLLHALALLRDRSGDGQELATTLVGDGPDLAAYRALAQRLGLRAVQFLGLRDDVPDLLAQHSIFALLSDHEGLPISMIEAMRAGLAIVASDLPGVRELLPDPDHGRIVPNRACALAHALEELVHNPLVRQRLGQGARQRYEAAHTPERMVQQLLTLYQHCAGGGGKDGDGGDRGDGSDVGVNNR